MNAFQNPAVQAFVAEIKTELLLAQVLIRRVEHGFELRHERDRQAAPGNLRLVGENEVRSLTQFTATGAFRPLKSAPNLQAGWRIIISDAAQLEFVLNQFYPGALADWFALRFGHAAPTHYREFTDRQTGMYRITAMLTDEQAAPMIRACCHKKFCLKQRLWTVEGLSPDAPGAKSLVPCLEPCAVLLEFARKAMRLEQEKAREKPSTKGEDENHPASEIREADFEHPNNPRRRELEIEKQNLVANKL